MLSTGTAYFGIRNPVHVATDLQRMKAQGLDTILLTYEEADVFYYRQTVARMCEIAKDLGFVVYLNPWGVGGVFGGQGMSELAARNPSWAQFDSLGSMRRACCPNAPGFREWMQRWLSEACGMAIDYVFLDEPHWYQPHVPQAFTCRCVHCQKAFRQIHGEAMPEVATPAVQAFLADSMCEFLTWLAGGTHALGRKTSIGLLPLWRYDSPFASLEQWRKLASHPSVDELGSTPYWKAQSAEEVRAMYRKACTDLLEITGEAGKEAHVWIKLFSIKRDAEDRVAAATEAAAVAGIERILCWSYLATGYMSRYACEDVETAWCTQLESFEEARNARP